MAMKFTKRSSLNRQERQERQGRKDQGQHFSSRPSVGFGRTPGAAPEISSWRSWRLGGSKKMGPTNPFSSSRRYEVGRYFLRVGSDPRSCENGERHDARHLTFANPAMPRALILPLTCLLFSFAAPSVTARPIVLVAFGDSTTALRKNLEVYATLLEKELPAKGIQAKVFNAGVGGNNTHDAMLRFQTDVLNRSPDVVILQFGINDSAVDVWKQPPADQPRVPLK